VWRPLRPLPLVVIILLCASPVRAEDAGAAIAGMKTEAEECRYVLDLCHRVRFNRSQLEAADEGTVPNSDLRTKREWLRSMAAADEKNLKAALAAMQAKHPHRPKCLDKCKDLGA